ncbi:Reverse transcriptase domain, partial [Cinara cedri]
MLILLSNVLADNLTYLILLLYLHHLVLNELDSGHETFRKNFDENLNNQKRYRDLDDINKSIEHIAGTIKVAVTQAQTRKHATTPQPTNSLTIAVQNPIKEKHKTRRIWQRTRNIAIKRRLNQLNRRVNLWLATKRILKQPNLIPPLKNGIAKYDTNYEKSEEFAEYFETCFTSEDNTTPQRESSDESPNVTNDKYSNTIIPTYPKEIQLIISKLKSKKSPGHDLITNKILKNLTFKALSYLASLFNSAMRIATFPSTWKHAIIVTIHKPGKPANSPTSYRPISLLPTLSKLSFQVRVETDFSQLHHIKAGVPQGSVLGPTLFNIYCNNYNIPTPPNSQLAMFADDTIILTQNSSLDLAIQNIQSSLNEITFWFKNWKLKLNLTKKKVKLISPKHIPRGCRTHHIPGLSSETMENYNSYINMFENNLRRTNQEQREELTNAIAQEKRNKWHKLLDKTDMKHSSKEAWGLIKRLNSDPTDAKGLSNVSPDQIAHQLLLNSKTKKSKQEDKPTKRIIRNKEKERNHLSRPFDEDEMNIAIETMKLRKAAGLDNIFVEQIRNFGPKAKQWLLTLYNEIRNRKIIPKIWRITKIIALLKPGKDKDDPKNYCPISLLCHTYKLFERMLLNRLVPFVESTLIKEQAGFRPGKSCTGQILNLTQKIENGFENKKIIGTSLVDLTAAYDTVNHRLMLKKLYDTTMDYEFVRIFEALLSNRRFFVNHQGKNSRWRIFKNGLPQGSVLAPTMFNIYTNDQPISTDSD